MKKTSYIWEPALFIIIMYCCQFFWSLSLESELFLSIIFIFCWFYQEQAKQIMLGYLTHTLLTGAMYLLLACGAALLIAHPHVFYVALCSGFIWALLVLSIRKFYHLRVSVPYTVLVHTELVSLLESSSKVNVINKTEVTPTDLKHVDFIVLDQKFDYKKAWRDLIVHAGHHQISVLTTSTYNELVSQCLTLESLNENWLSNGLQISAGYYFLKNLLDKVFIVLILPIFLIILCIVSLAILFSMGRPIFYSQKRVGKDGQEFSIYKFRSMKKSSENSGPKFAQTNDMRVTTLGKILRKYRLDELPQMFNVLKGDMSLIGPRPEQKYFVKQFEEEIPLYKLRHVVKPGISGWAQVMHGYASGEDETKEKLRYDLYYIKHFSLLLDLKIFFKTVYTVLSGFKAR